MPAMPGPAAVLLLALASRLMVEAQGQSCPPAPQLTGQDALSIVCANGSGVAARSPACSIWRLCQDTRTPRMYPSMCNTTRLAATLCLDDADVISQIPSCTSYAAQRQTVLTPSCKAQLGYFSIYSTNSTAQAAGRNCAAMGGTGMAGCELCPAPDASCTDPLVALGQGCAEMPMSQCRVAPTITDFCASEAAGPNGEAGYAAPHICFSPAQLSTMSIPQPSPAPAPGPAPAPVPAPVPAPAPQPSPAPSLAPSPASAPTCVADPTAAACASYTYPAANATADLGALCTAGVSGSMPDMPGCSIWAACQAGQASSRWCAPLLLLATICYDPDMVAMKGCASFNTMCKTAGSKVPECAAVGQGIAGVPTWSAARQSIFDICGNHYMRQCSLCPKVGSCPNPLGTLVDMCAEMPTMPQCLTTIQPFCSGVASAGGGLPALCTDGGEAAHPSNKPSMIMYFHERYQEYVLWQSWVPQTQGQYAGTILCVLLFGVVSMALKTWAACLGLAWRQATPLAARSSMRYGYLLPHGPQAIYNTAKALITAMAVCLDYWNMLIAMTFNVGLFVAVVLGYALGALLLSHIPENYALHLAERRAAEEEAAAAAHKLEDSEEGAYVNGHGIRVRPKGPGGEGALELELSREPPSCCPALC